MQDTWEIFRNKYHIKCKFTKLTYCTCVKGSRSFHYSGDGEFKSMFESILPSPQIHDLLKLLAESKEAEIVSRSNTQKYKHVERIVAREREEFNRQYERERKRVREANSEGSPETGVSGDPECSEDAGGAEASEAVSDGSPATRCCAEECPDGDSSESLVGCDVCHKHFHTSCCSPRISECVGSAFPWVCSECVSCSVCRRRDRQNTQVFCDICSRCFHISCLSPKLQKVPRSFWLCDDCKVCSRCHKLVSFPVENGDIRPDSLPEEGFDYFDSKYGTRICYECKESHEDLVCEVCNKALSARGNRVCSLCRMFVHSSCISAQICNFCSQ